MLTTKYGGVLEKWTSNPSSRRLQKKEREYEYVKPHQNRFRRRGRLVAKKNPEGGLPKSAANCARKRRLHNRLQRKEGREKRKKGKKRCFHLHPSERRTKSFLCFDGQQGRAFRKRFEAAKKRELTSGNSGERV